MNTTTQQDALIDAAEERAKLYDGDDREWIKADVMNAFFAGAQFTQAAANKAAEEGGLPAIPAHWESKAQWIVSGSNLESEERGRLAVMLLRVLLAADRASRQVANKTEVEAIYQFSWLGDNNWTDCTKEHYDEFAKSIWPCRIVYASPAEIAPISTCLSDSEVDDMAFGYAPSGNIGELRELIRAVETKVATPPATNGGANATPTGASTVLTDERIEASIDTPKFQDLISNLESLSIDEDGYEKCKAAWGEVVAHIDQHVAREVAAQAGQVAVPEIDLSKLDRYIIQDGEDERPDLAKAAKGGLVLFSDVEDILSKPGQDLKVKPVIWVDINSIEDTGLLFGTTRHLTITGSSEKFGDYTTPLYAAPSPAKESK